MAESETLSGAVCSVPVPTFLRTRRWSPLYNPKRVSVNLFVGSTVRTSQTYGSS